MSLDSKFPNTPCAIVPLKPKELRQEADLMKSSLPATAPRQNLPIVSAGMLKEDISDDASDNRFTFNLSVISNDWEAKFTFDTLEFTRAIIH